MMAKPSSPQVPTRRTGRTEKDDARGKKPGRLKQVAEVFQMTRRYDPAAVWWMIGVFASSVLLFTLAGQFVLGGNWITGLLVGLSVGVLTAMLVLSRRAERAAFAQIEGQTGAAGAALSTLRRGWVVEEQPVAVNPRTQELVFRVVGRVGVVLVTEGPSNRVRQLAQSEQRRLSRFLPNVPVHIVETGRGEGQTPLHQLSGALKKLKKTLTKAEVHAVGLRLSSLKPALPIPKGIDPRKARPDRRALRGR